MAVEAVRSEKVDANPTKRFFVRMITRDISLEDCILDLIDNSIDSAWRSEGSRPVGLADCVDLRKYRIDIHAYPDRFIITDNCGGMSLDNAIRHAFSFGRQDSDVHDDYSIGVYGIGMKRAVFKLGTAIKVRSTFREEGGATESFQVPINVGEWLLDESLPWDFDIDEDEPLAEPGVEIVVGDLTAGASASFDSPAFVENLKRTIARDYSLHLARGLHIAVNDVRVSGWKIELRQGQDFEPMRSCYVDEIDEVKVDVEVIGGMAAVPPESSDPDEGDDGEQRYGWYVICNGRIVLAADKSAISGWGTDKWPQWHRQYSGFIGLVLFSSPSAAALPLTTTKRSVDTSSEIFRRARGRMRDVSRQWIDYTNKRKQALEEAKIKESTARAVPIYDVRMRDTVALPSLIPDEVKEPLANVNYSVPVAKLKKLAQELGSIRMSNREVGLRSFDYTYSDFVGDE